MEVMEDAAEGQEDLKGGHTAEKSRGGGEP